MGDMIAKVNETSIRYISQYATSNTNISVKPLDNEEDDKKEIQRKDTEEIKDSNLYRDIPLIDFI